MDLMSVWVLGGEGKAEDGRWESSAFLGRHVTLGSDLQVPTQRGNGKVQRASLSLVVQPIIMPFLLPSFFILRMHLKRECHTTAFSQLHIPTRKLGSSCHFSRRCEAACSSDDLHLLTFNSQLMNGSAFNPSFRTLNIVDCPSDAS